MPIFPRSVPLNAMAFFSVLDFIAAYKLALYWMGIIKTPTVRKPLIQLDATLQRELRGAPEIHPGKKL